MKRQRRGLINGLGNIIKSLTGNLDQEDARRYDSEIDTLKQNQNNIKLSMDKQLSLLHKTINNFEEVAKNISHNQLILKKHIDIIAETINSIRSDMSTLREYYRIQMVLTQISMMYQNIYDILEQIEVAISFAKVNNFHNSIVKPSELLEELLLINNKLSTEKLPFQAIPENILIFENILDIKSYSKNNEIIFIIEVPLVEKENYNLFNLFPLPTPTGNHFKMIIPNFQYLIINDKNFGYSNLPCNKIFDNEYLCKHIHTENFYKDSPCEVQLLTYQHNITSCNPIPVKINSVQVQHVDDGKWILITDKDLTAVQQCASEKENIFLNGTYLAEINFPCSLRIADIVIKSYHNIKRNFYNVPLPVIKFNFSQNSIHNDLKSTSLNNVNLNKLDILQNEILSQKHENLKMLESPVYYNRTSFWTILLYIFSISIIVYIVFRYLRPIFCIERKQNSNEDIVI